MKLSLSTLLALSCLSFALCEQTQAGHIRLRNGDIDTDDATNSVAMAKLSKVQGSVSGLYLVQFSGPLDQSQREQLKAAGVDLLKYVPDDSFIVKLDKTNPKNVQNLGFVTWLGPYQPEFKVHAKVAEKAPQAAQS